MLTFSDEVLRKKIRQELHEDADHIAFLPFSGLRRSVLDDIKILKKNKLLLDVPVTGYIYDVKTGMVEKVREGAVSSNGGLSNGVTNGI
jgi:carbonic anhydrase